MYKRQFKNPYHYIQHIQGVHTQTNLIVDPKFDIALGRFYNAVIVEDLSVAKHCIHTLIQHRLPPLLFVPIHYSYEVGTDPRLLCHQIDCPSQYRSVIEFMCKNTMYVISQQDVPAGHNGKVVLFNNTVVHANHCITGGTHKSSSTAKLTKQLAQLQDQLTKYKDEQRRIHEHQLEAKCIQLQLQPVSYTHLTLPTTPYV